MDSILTSVKKMLGIVEDYTQFDADIIMHINSVFAVLNQLGVGPKAGFTISNAEGTWDDFDEDGALSPTISFIKSYVYLKVRLLFDPPLTAAVLESMNNQISELEWRLNVAVDPGQSTS